VPDAVNKAKGVDAELSGRFAPGWLIGAGYTFNKQSGTDGRSGSLPGTQQPDY
jgi:outer membrane receptor for ferric coprogen and ferric-rhodotorulic acid